MRRTHKEEAGSPIAATGSRNDEALARRKDELEMMLAASGLGFCRIGREQAIASVDCCFKALFGFAPDATPTWVDLEQRVEAGHRTRVFHAVRAALEVGTAFDMTVRVEGTEPRYVALRGRVLADPVDSAAFLLLAARDATAEQNRLAALAAELASERQLRECAEAANHAKDEFLSVVSHELRSPLNAILGWNRILAIKRAEDPEVAAVAPRIEQSARAQLKMVNDLLDLGRIGTGKLHITPRPTKLATIVAMAVDAIRPSAAAKHLGLYTDLHGATGAMQGDPDRLSQVVSNLLSNAVKFTPPGGRITVSLRELEGRVELSIADTGQGIAAELLPHIFDRFRQGDSSTTRRTAGLGLGLTLVREIVSLHGGSVCARSGGEGRGSTFVVTLPTAVRPPPGSVADGHGGREALGSPRRLLAGLSILVVDDEADARAVVAETLRLEGASVTVGDSASAALTHLRAPHAHFDVMVTDIGMPEEDGYSLVRKLRALQSGERVVAIALTGYASRGDVEAAIDAGFDLHVPKPVDFDSFVPIIRRLAGLHA